MPNVSRKQLIWLSHDLATMLSAGLPVSRALETMGSRGGSPRLRAAIRRVGRRVQEGATLAEALAEQRCFPPLFLHAVAAGEQGGALDRVLGELLRFYELQQRLWRRFVGQIALPVVQYVAAVAVVSFATYIINMLGGRPGVGALVRGLLIGYGVPVGLVAFYHFVVKPLGGTRLCHEILLRIPVAGKTMLYLALARFSLVMYVMMEAGVPVKESLARALEATSNGAFAARARGATRVIQSGSRLTDALAGTGLFPVQYLEVVEVAEESGKLSERLDWLCAHYTERAEFALRALAVVLAWLIWIAVAAVIIYFIFSICFNINNIFCIKFFINVFRI